MISWRWALHSLLRVMGLDICGIPRKVNSQWTYLIWWFLCVEMFKRTLECDVFGAYLGCVGVGSYLGYVSSCGVDAMISLTTWLVDDTWWSNTWHSYGSIQRLIGLMQCQAMKILHMIHAFWLEVVRWHGFSFLWEIFLRMKHLGDE